MAHRLDGMGRGQSNGRGAAPTGRKDGCGAEACPECGSRRLDHDVSRAEVSCAECGIVVAENLIDAGPDWRAYESGERASRERAGAPLSILQHDLGLGAVMWGRTDAHGKAIDGAGMTRIRRMQKWDRRARFKRGAERNLAHALSEIQRMGSGLDVPRQVQEQAAKLYREAAAQNLIRGRSIDSVSAACLYAAMRNTGVPRSLEEVSEVSKAKKREIGRVYKVVAAELNLLLKPVSPASFIPRFASRLRLHNRAEVAALELVQRAVQAEVVSGKDPKSIAAGAIYIAGVLAGEPRTQKDVSEASGVTEVTIRNRYKELVEALQIEFDFSA